MSSQKDLLSTRQHFEVLDGMRGIAAIAVVMFHFIEIAITDYSNNFIAHAYLAVDFFFCLSGFVIAYAYDNRLPAIGLSSFFKLRLIRLHPLVVLTSIFGLIMFVADPFSNLWTKYADKLWLMTGASCLMIPYPIVKERFFNLFHLNPPTWSLFWEYVANIFYAFVLVRLRNKLLWCLVIIGAGLLYYEAHVYTQLSVGWDGASFWGGGVRVLYSFLAGMLVYRLQWIIRSRLGLVSMGILLFLVFITPFSPKYNQFVEPTIVVLYLPLLVMLGAGAVMRKPLQKIGQFLGNISYPLYMVHYPFMWVFLSYVEKVKPSLPNMLTIAAIGTVLLIGLAYAVLVWVDAPVRQWLKQRFVKAKTAGKPVIAE